jgi:HD-GYP domain-containing protein (c-di-GMP phosphodiesterase class II)
MILETTSLLVGLSGTTVPIWLWLNERSHRNSMEMEYNIRVAHSLGHAAALRDHETGAHNYRVTYLSSLFGEAIGLSKTALKGLMKGAYLHDVGKIGIPDAILLKKGPLSFEEWQEMRLHPYLGKQLVDQMPWFVDALPVIVHHHEKFDGSGYPDGLKGNSIPLEARIFAIVDVFDALLSVRPYKEAFPLDQALECIRKDARTHFDPDLVATFLGAAEEYARRIAHRPEAELEAMVELRRKAVFGR